MGGSDVFQRTHRVEVSNAGTYKSWKPDNVAKREDGA